MNRKDYERYESLIEQKEIEIGYKKYLLREVDWDYIRLFDREYTNLIKMLHLWNVKEERTKALRVLLYQSRFDVFQFVRFMMHRANLRLESRNHGGYGLVMDFIKKGDIPFDVCFSLEPSERYWSNRGILVLGYYSEPDEPDGWVQWKVDGIGYAKHTLPWSITESHTLKEVPPIYLFGTGRVKASDPNLGILGIKVASADILREKTDIVEVKE